VKSVLKQESLSFEALLGRLKAHVNGRIQNGECTERGLARILGISQPQVHNVLKGVRRLQPQFADRFMEKFGISVLDLLQHSELSAGRNARRGHLDRLESASPATRKPAARQLFERPNRERTG
jgi:plasmid maintenance system antidote protein VapI